MRLISISIPRLTVGFVEAGGCVPEKFNAVEGTSNIDAEYGNQVRLSNLIQLVDEELTIRVTRSQGTDFALIPREGFGW